MLEYRDTRTLDPATWTAEARNRLIEFVRILLEWEAARPQTDASTHDHEAHRHDQADGDRNGVGLELRILAPNPGWRNVARREPSALL
jgi:hypothetical protein